MHLVLIAFWNAFLRNQFFRKEVSIVSVDHFVINYPFSLMQRALLYYHRIFDFDEIWFVQEVRLNFSQFVENLQLVRICSRVS